MYLTLHYIRTNFILFMRLGKRVRWIGCVAFQAGEYSISGQSTVPVWTGVETGSAFGVAQRMGRGSEILRHTYPWVWYGQNVRLHAVIWGFPQRRAPLGGKALHHRRRLWWNAGGWRERLEGLYSDVCYRLSARSGIWGRFFASLDLI